MFKNMEILVPFFDEPNREFSVREFARAAKISPAAASYQLKGLAKQKFLLSREERRCVLYKADESSDAYRDAKLYRNIRRIRLSGLIGFLEKELQHPLAIFLFGSYAKAENRKGSDLDIFVLSNKKKQLNIEQYEKSIGAPIQLFVHSPQEVVLLKNKNPNLLNNIANGVRLYGFWEVLDV